MLVTMETRLYNRRDATTIDDHNCATMPMKNVWSSTATPERQQARILAVEELQLCLPGLLLTVKYVTIILMSINIHMHVHMYSHACASVYKLNRYIFIFYAYCHL